MPLLPMGYQGQSEGLLGDATGQYRRAGLMGAQAGNLWSGSVAPGYGALMQSAAYQPDLVNRAGIDASMQSQNLKGQYERGLSRMGVNPNSGRFAGLMQNWALGAAANKSGEMNKAARAEREGKFNRLLSSVGLGQGLFGQAQSGLGTAGQGLMRSAGEYGSLASAAEEQARTDAALNERGAPVMPLMDPATRDPGNQAAYDRMRQDWGENNALMQNSNRGRYNYTTLL